MVQTLYDLEIVHRHIEDLAREHRHYEMPESRADRSVFRSVSHVLGRGLIRAGEALGGRECGQLRAGAHARPAGTSQWP